MASAAARKKTSAGMSDKTSDIILVAICAIALIIVAYPLYYVLVASISDPYDVYAGKTFLLPSGFTLDGYKAVFADPKIVSGFLNSVKYTVIGTCFSVIMLYITAYPLADKNLPGRKWISLFFVFTMYFGGGLVPTYLVVQDTGLIGSMWSLFLPAGVGGGRFDPDGLVTREQMAVMLYRMAAYLGLDTAVQGGLSGFSDSGEVSSWAEAALAWAVGADILQGEDGRLMPQGTASRAEIAAVLMRFDALKK